MSFFIKAFPSIFLLLSLAGCLQGEGQQPTSSNGVGGSTARFVIQNNHLITVEDDFLQVFSLASATQPQLTNSYYTNTNLVLETIYPYEENKIMLGTNQGAIIMDHSTHGALHEISFAGHFTSCDPVIAHNGYMYVTLRAGQNCGLVNNTQGVNQLLVYDIQDITQPNLIKTIELDQPWGLGVKDNSLFVCYAQGVLKFDISDPLAIVQTGDYSASCNDIIPSDPMILTGDDGIRLVEDNGTGLVELAIIRKGT